MAEHGKRVPRRIEAIAKKSLLDDFFKVDEHIVSHERFDGAMSEPQRVLVFERGDAAAALLYNKADRKVILINQFRLPTLGKAGSQGWLTETAAGMIQPDETAERCIVREIAEETGYQVTHLTPVATFFASPGGSSELIYLFYAEVRATDKVLPGGGALRDGENIQIEEYPLKVFLQMLANREFTDPKVIIAGQWLRDRHDWSSVIPDPSKVAYRVRDADGKPTDRVVGYVTGDLLKIRDVDVWVNTENTDMIMDRFFGRSISALIRLHGATKVRGTDRVDRDVIAEELAKLMGGRPFVRPAFVLNTTSGELARTNNVRRIFHVASVEGNAGEGVRTNKETLADCVSNVLVEIERTSSWLETYRSVVIPMIGTGEGGYFVGEVAPTLIGRAVQFFQQRPGSKLQSVYFLAYSVADEEILSAVLRGMPDKLDPF